MSGKAFKIMLISFLAIFAVSHNAMAQDEGGFPIKEEVRPDSIPDLEMMEEAKSLPIESTTDELSPLTNQKDSDIFIIPVKPQVNPNLNTPENKPKIKETKSESSFNIFYYLIYKFRSKEGSGE